MTLQYIFDNIIKNNDDIEIIDGDTILSVPITDILT